MNPRRASTVIAGILWFSVAAFARTQQPRTARVSTAPGSIAGTVTSATTGQPVAGAWVVLRVVGMMRAGLKYISVHKTTTDHNGHFEIGDIAPGLYSLQFGHPGYVTESYKPSTPGADQDFQVRPGERLAGVNVRLVRVAIISGRVMDKAGNPLPYASVDAWRVEYTYDGQREFRAAGSSGTNDLGQFRLFALGPGSYYVAATYLPGTPRTFPPEYHNPNREIYATAYPKPFFYPGTTDLRKATELLVGPGQEISGIDFRLVAKVTHEVSGMATGAPAEEKLGPVKVFLTRPSQPLNQYFWPGRPLAAQVESDGHFFFRNVVAGSYMLWATQKTRHGQISAREPLNVDGASVSGLKVTLALGTDVAGRVDMEGPALGYRGEWGVILQLGSLLGIGAPVRKDGTFDIANVPPGSYRVRMQGLTDDEYLKSAWFDDQDVLTAPIEIGHGPAKRQLRLVVDTRGGEISGVVKGAGRRPQAGATVTLVPEARLRNAVNFYVTAPSNSAGRFTLRGIRPGKYTVFAWEKIQGYPWFDPLFLKAVESGGRTVEVGLGQRKTVDLEALPQFFGMTGRK